MEVPSKSFKIITDLLESLNYLPSGLLVGKKPQPKEIVKLLLKNR